METAQTPTRITILRQTHHGLKFLSIMHYFQWFQLRVTIFETVIQPKDLCFFFRNSVIEYTPLNEVINVQNTFCFYKCWSSMGIYVALTEKSVYRKIEKTKGRHSCERSRASLADQRTTALLVTDVSLPIRTIRNAILEINIVSVYVAITVKGNECISECQ